MILRIDTAIVVVALSVWIAARPTTGETIRHQLIAPGGEAANDVKNRLAKRPKKNPR